MSRVRVVSATAVALLSLVSSSCATEPSSGGRQAVDQVLFSESPPMWYEAYFTDLKVAPGGEHAILDYRRLVDLTTGVEMDPRVDLDVVFSARFDADGTLLVAGRQGSEEGWFRYEAGDGTGQGGRASLDEDLPPQTSLTPSPSGERFAYWTHADPRTLLTIGTIGAEAGRETPSAHPLPGPASALAWLRDEASVLVYVADEAGVGALHRVDLETGDVATVADRLDGPSFNPRIAVSSDERLVYVALASPDAPEPEVRHDPYADRDLDIWEIDLATGERRRVVTSPAEEMAPTVVDGALYWVSIETRSEIALVPMAAFSAGSPETGTERGQVRVVAADVQIPTWRPDGRALGAVTGDWRRADWGLNLDAGMLEIDGEGRATGPVTPIITGYHEDFAPVWSPDGAWIAYHSHRSAAPVPGYSAEGSSDDIYLRRPGAQANTDEEIRLTDFGIEVGNPDWAPDGRRLVMDSWNEGGGSSTWIVALDPETGAFLGRVLVPQPDGAVGSPAWSAWSPAREEIGIVYAGGGGTELWVMTPDGSDARQIAQWKGGRYGGLDWSADGESLVYGAPVDGRVQLYTVPRRGGEPRQLTDDAANLMHPQVSPDGRWVAVSRIRHERRIMRMSP